MPHLNVDQISGFLRLANYFTIVGLTVVIIDYMCTLPGEVQLIWLARLSIPKLIFLTVRYGNIALGVVECLYMFGVLSPEGCRKAFTAIIVFDGLLASLGEAIVYLRVVAFSGKDSRVVWLLSSVYSALCIFSITFAVRWLVSVKAVASYSVVPGLGCAVSQGDTAYTTMLHGALSFSATFLAGMMVAIGLSKYKLTDIPHHIRGGELLAQFYDTGVGYFLVLVALNAANILVNTLAPFGARFMLSRFQTHLHGVIALRIILHLREYSARTERLSLPYNSTANLK